MLLQFLSVCEGYTFLTCSDSIGQDALFDTPVETGEGGCAPAGPLGSRGAAVLYLPMMRF